MRRVGLPRVAILFDLLHVSMDHRVIGGAKRRRSSNGCARWGRGKEMPWEGKCAGNDERSCGPYCAGPSWQDCGATGESRCQVGTSHFEQAASESPSRSKATIGKHRGMSSRTRRLPSARNLVCIRKPTPHHSPHDGLCHKTATILRRPERKRTDGKTEAGRRCGFSAISHVD